METIAIILFGGVCFALGMYLTTQISQWIDNRIQHKEFMKNIDKYDKRKTTKINNKK
jgi:hypothetical protein|tara:strand:+ start:1819 stop:1989 length:171 start_codon:yes stop_codon:yes gene_type:complete